MLTQIDNSTVTVTLPAPLTSCSAMPLSCSKIATSSPGNRYLTNSTPSQLRERRILIKTLAFQFRIVNFLHRVMLRLQLVNWNCNIQPRQPLPNQFNTITAQGKKDPNQNTGISIQNCKFSASCSKIATSSPGNRYLTNSTPSQLRERRILIKTLAFQFRIVNFLHRVMLRLQLTLLGLGKIIPLLSLCSPILGRSWDHQVGCHGSVVWIHLPLYFMQSIRIRGLVLEWMEGSNGPVTSQLLH